MSTSALVLYQPDVVSVQRVDGSGIAAHQLGMLISSGIAEKVAEWFSDLLRVLSDKMRVFMTTKGQFDGTAIAFTFLTYLDRSKHLHSVSINDVSGYLEPTGRNLRPVSLQLLAFQYAMWIMEWMRAGVVGMSVMNAVIHRVDEDVAMSSFVSDVGKMTNVGKWWTEYAFLCSVDLRCIISPNEAITLGQYMDIVRFPVISSEQFVTVHSLMSALNVEINEDIAPGVGESNEHVLKDPSGWLSILGCMSVWFVGVCENVQTARTDIMTQTSLFVFNQDLDPVLEALVTTYVSPFDTLELTDDQIRIILHGRGQYTGLRTSSSYTVAQIQDATLIIGVMGGFMTVYSLSSAAIDTYGEGRNVLQMIDEWAGIQSEKAARMVSNVAQNSEFVDLFKTVTGMRRVIDMYVNYFATASISMVSDVVNSCVEFHISDMGGSSESLNRQITDLNAKVAALKSDVVERERELEECLQQSTVQQQAMADEMKRRNIRLEKAAGRPAKAAGADGRIGLYVGRTQMGRKRRYGLDEPQYVSPGTFMSYVRKGRKLFGTDYVIPHHPVPVDGAVVVTGGWNMKECVRRGTEFQKNRGTPIYMGGNPYHRNNSGKTVESMEDVVEAALDQAKATSSGLQVATMDRLLGTVARSGELMVNALIAPNTPGVDDRQLAMYIKAVVIKLFGEGLREVVSSSSGESEIILVDRAMDELHLIVIDGLCAVASSDSDQRSRMERADLVMWVVKQIGIMMDWMQMYVRWANSVCAASVHARRSKRARNGDGLERCREVLRSLCVSKDILEEYVLPFCEDESVIAEFLSVDGDARIDLRLVPLWVHYIESHIGLFGRQ